MIKSIYSSQDECLQAILDLIEIKQFDLDPCYSKGNFYKKIAQPKYASDITPLFPFVEERSADNLTFKDSSLWSIIFDPPFLATKGPSLKGTDGNEILRRFTVFPTEPELFQFYYRCMVEFYRVLRSNGFLVFKCQDKVSSGKQYLSHCLIYEMALKIGYYPKDLFILENKTKMLGKWANMKQQHALKYHCYFMIFQKVAPKVTLNKLGV